MMGTFFKRRYWFILVALVVIFLIGGLLAEYYFKFEEICTPDKGKNKVAIVVAKDSIYDTDRMNSQVLEYYRSVKKDLNIENRGLKKFGGKTFEELDKFVESLYLNDNVGYIIFVGDDLPVIREETVEFISEDNATGIKTYHRRDSKGRDEITESVGWGTYVGKFAYLDEAYTKKLECVKKGCEPLHIASCRAVAVSFIFPPLFYSNDEKLDFVLGILASYTNYHENFAAISKKYLQSLLYIYDPIIGEEYKNDDIAALKGGLPVIEVLNTEPEKATAELKKKHIIMSYAVHGVETGVGISLWYDDGRPPPPIGKPYYTTFEEYSKFAKENGAPALFIVSQGASYGNTLRHTDENIKYCCWRQIYLESGIWAIYSFGGSGGQFTRMQRLITDGTTIGLAIRTRVTQGDYVFGDILAHMK